MVLTRFEGMECMNYSPFVYALGPAEHRDHRRAARSTARPTASIGGRGAEGALRRAFDGPDQRKARAALMDMAEREVPVAKRVFGEGGWLRPDVHPALPLH